MCVRVLRWVLVLKVHTHAALAAHEACTRPSNRREIPLVIGVAQANRYDGRCGIPVLFKKIFVVFSKKCFPLGLLLSVPFIVQQIPK